MSQIDGFYQSQFNPQIHHQSHQSHQSFYGTAPAPNPLQPFPQSNAGPQSPFQHHQYGNLSAVGQSGFQQNGQNQHQPSYQQPNVGPVTSGQQQSNAYTTAGFSQSVPAPSVTPGQQYQGSTATASPNQLGFGTTSPTFKPSSLTSAMAAPPAPRGTQSPQTTGPLSLPQCPNSVIAQAREKERISLLLDINVELLQEIHALQEQGQGGAQNAVQVDMLQKQGQPNKMASAEYIQTLARLHANLGYLCAQSDMQKPGAKSPHPPSFMKAPTNIPDLEAKYTALRRLFPGWTGRDGPTESHFNGVQSDNAGTHMSGFVPS